MMSTTAYMICGYGQLCALLYLTFLALRVSSYFVSPGMIGKNSLFTVRSANSSTQAFTRTHTLFVRDTTSIACTLLTQPHELIIQMTK